MLSAPQIIHEAESLLVNERAQIVDSLLRSLNQPSADIDQQWVTTAQQRLADLQSSAVQAISLDDVIQRLKSRFAE